MTNERRIKLVNELNAISKRIQAKQDEGVKKYCKNAPEEIANRTFSAMKEISSIINLYHFINSLSAEEYRSIENSPTVIVENISFISVNEVEKLEKNYYYSIVEEFCDFCNRVIKNFGTDEKEKINKYLSHLNIKIYIENHKESFKITNLIEILKDLDDFCLGDCHDLYKLLGYKEVLLEYERGLNDISSVNDINLKRAIYNYINENTDFF